MGENSSNKGEQLSFEQTDEPSHAEEPKVTPEHSEVTEKAPATVEETIRHRFEAKKFRATGIEGNFAEHIQHLAWLKETNAIGAKTESEILEKVFLENFRSKNDRDVLLSLLRKDLEREKNLLAEAEKIYDAQDHAGAIYNHSFEQERAKVEGIEAVISYVEGADEMIRKAETLVAQIREEALQTFETKEATILINNSGYRRTIHQATDYVLGMDPQRNPKASEEEFRILRENLGALISNNLDPEHRKQLVLALGEQANEALLEYTAELQKKERGLEYSESELENRKRQYEEGNRIFELVSSIITGRGYNA